MRWRRTLAAPTATATAGYGGAYSDEMAAHARRYSDDNDGAASGYGFEHDVGEADLGGAEFFGSTA